VVEELLSQGVHRVGGVWIIKYYREGHKECVKESLRMLEFAVNIKLKRDRVLESSKEGRGSKSLHRNQDQEGHQIIENLNGRLNFSKGETPNSHGPLDPMDQWRG
jgi:hypothetical protein